jgi:hypothetical protein
MKEQIREILHAVSMGNDSYPTDAIEALLAMSPQAKMALADILNGHIAYEPEIWEEIQAAA